MPSFVKLATLEELPDGGGLEVVHGDLVIALFRDGETVRAIDGICPHQGGPLADGEVQGTVVTCPWHDWKFDICTGKTQHKSKFQVETFEVRVEGGDVLVALP